MAIIDLGLGLGLGSCCGESMLEERDAWKVAFKIFRALLSIVSSGLSSL